MSIFVGAVMPRQNTAFASEERKSRAAAKQVTATPTRSTRCIGSVRRSEKPQCYAGPAVKPREVPNVLRGRVGDREKRYGVDDVMFFR
jgi:hypothetical protein